MQERYWTQMTQFKYSLCYLAVHFARSVRRNRSIKIGVAIASASSIAAWAVWAECSFVWGFIIAAGQVVSAVNDILPYQKRIKELAELQPRLNAVYIEVERQWFSVANGSLSESEINNLCYKQMQAWDKIDQEYFREDMLPRIEECVILAEKEKNIYFKNRFGVEV